MCPHHRERPDKNTQKPVWKVVIKSTDLSDCESSCFLPSFFPPSFVPSFLDYLSPCHMLGTSLGSEDDTNLCLQEAYRLVTNQPGGKVNVESV